MFGGFKGRYLESCIFNLPSGAVRVNMSDYKEAGIWESAF